MAKEHLIPLNQRTKEEARIIQSKGGRTKSPQKKLAARIRELKKKGLDNADAKLLTDMMQNGEVLDLDILIGLRKLVLHKDDKTKNAAYALLLKLSEKLHGTNKINTQVNIQNNTSMNISFKELEEIYNEYK